VRKDRVPARGVRAMLPSSGGLGDQAATAGRLMVAVSLNVPRVSRLM